MNWLYNCEKIVRLEPKDIALRMGISTQRYYTLRQSQDHNTAILKRFVSIPEARGKETKILKVFFTWVLDKEKGAEAPEEMEN